MRGSIRTTICFFIFAFSVYCQSVSFQTYMNPIIPGDHPDPTLTKIGIHFYTSGSSFNITPRIYHSTDLVHWEVISQPVPASWNLYGDQPAGGVWGGHMVYYNGSYWHFFARAGTMYFVKADDPEGPWSSPVRINVVSGISGYGQDNSIFIDDDNRWYLLAKNGQSGNWIVELNDNGQPTGVVHDLTWINPGPAYPYSWAEGPVMWKRDGYYYYCFARNVAGGQHIMRSEELTGDQAYWWAITDFYETVDNPNEILFKGPNHCSPAVTLDDGTSWVLSQAYSSGTLEWHGQGRQGILNQVRYDPGGNAVADYTSNDAVTAPDLPSSGIPWMVPHSDFFDSDVLNPEWSFSGYTPDNSHSITERPGWFKLSPRGKANTIVKNDGEYNYSLITRIDFDPSSTEDEAGFWLFNGLETIYAKLNSTLNSSGNKVISFSFTGGTYYETENTVGNIVWLKLIRASHLLTGHFSEDGENWTQVGEAINVSAMDKNQPNYNGWIGTQQGLYVKGKTAYFDFYIYRDAYTPIKAHHPANQLGTLRVLNGKAPDYLENIDNNDWAMYAGVEFSGKDFYKKPVSIEISAASAGSGGVVEVWLDSIETGNMIAECTIENTGGWNNFQTFTADVDSVSGNHDVYLRFTGSGELFIIDWFKFIGENYIPTSVKTEDRTSIIGKYNLEQNYPNPFNPVTTISYTIPEKSYHSLKVFNVTGEEIKTLFVGFRDAGSYTETFDAEELSSGVYFYQLKTEGIVYTKKLVLLK
ncbi:MAG: family 43 glycosylhydrolase [Melioribacteraceae bacterium]|nr:family 43 glycosylhydrolase [Melioribacteraceae bacterium]